MKRLFLALGVLTLLSGIARAGTPEEWNYIPYSSFSITATPGTVLFTSATIQFVAITISSPAIGSSITIFRSTSPTFTADITTQAFINTDYSYMTGSIHLPLYEMKNTSYTYINKVGGAITTIWLRCVPPTKSRNGLCPGLSGTGQYGTKIEFPQ